MMSRILTNHILSQCKVWMCWPGKQKCVINWLNKNDLKAWNCSLIYFTDLVRTAANEGNILVEITSIQQTQAWSFAIHFNAFECLVWLKQFFFFCGDAKLISESKGTKRRELLGSTISYLWVPSSNLGAETGCFCIGFTWVFTNPTR
jgi:hypothetical protein